MKENTLYLECCSGISGDMTVAALLDLGVNEKKFLEEINSIPVNGFDVRISRVKKAGLDVCDFDVVLDDENHDMAYSHGETSEHHHHEDNQPHEHHHKHEHRGLPEIIDIIRRTDITDNAKKIAERIFEIIGEAEAKVHGVPMNEVHFHEVGAVDSIVDIIAVAICLDDLNITKCVVPQVCEGYGTVRCQHGILPVPVPAVANIISRYNIKLSIMDLQGEFVTPTGAAIIAAIKTSDKLPEGFSIDKLGMGAGKREYDRPSILRAMLISEDIKHLNI